MKIKRTLLFPVIVLTVHQFALPNPGQQPLAVEASASAGFGYMSMKDLSSYFQSRVDSYVALGIPIRIQTPFGRTVGTNIGVLFSFREDISAGPSLGYWYSPAYAIYQDYYGTLKVRGSVTGYDVSLKTRYSSVLVGNLSLLFSSQVGGCYSSVTTTGDARINNYSGGNSNWKVTTAGWGFLAVVTAGASMTWGEFRAAIEGGYRFARVECALGNNPLPIGIGQQGVIALVSIGMKL